MHCTGWQIGEDARHVIDWYLSYALEREFHRLIKPTRWEMIKSSEPRVPLPAPGTEQRNIFSPSYRDDSCVPNGHKPTECAFMKFASDSFFCLMWILRGRWAFYCRVLNPCVAELCKSIAERSNEWKESHEVKINLELVSCLRCRLLPLHKAIITSNHHAIKPRIVVKLHSNVIFCYAKLHKRPWKQFGNHKLRRK